MKPPAVAVRKNSSGGSKLNFDRLKSNFDGGKPAPGGGGQLQRKKSNPFDDDDDEDEQDNDQTIDIDQDPFEGKSRALFRLLYRGSITLHNLRVLTCFLTQLAINGSLRLQWLYFWETKLFSAKS